MYKQLSIIFVALFLAFNLHSQQPTTQPTSQPSPQKVSFPIMTFDTRMIDLGDVERGEVKDFEFLYTNTGTGPLKIELVSSCDCTTTDYSPLEVAPGESSEIKVRFDSTEKEESEVIDIDIFLENEDPELGIPIIEMIQYKYNLIKK